MNSWPMIANCMVRQWNGLTIEEKCIIEQAWTDGHWGIPHPTNVGHRETLIWGVDRIDDALGVLVRRTVQDNLITIKEDHWPVDLDTEKSQA